MSETRIELLKDDKGVYGLGLVGRGEKRLKPLITRPDRLAKIDWELDRVFFQKISYYSNILPSLLFEVALPLLLCPLYMTPVSFSILMNTPSPRFDLDNISLDVFSLHLAVPDLIMLLPPTLFVTFRILLILDRILKFLSLVKT